jgi:opacity protein-like surface antigen
MKNVHPNTQPRKIMKNKRIKNLSIYFLFIGLSFIPIASALTVVENERMGSPTVTSCDPYNPYLRSCPTFCTPRQGGYIGIGGGLAWHHKQEFRYPRSSNNPPGDTHLKYDLGGEGFLSLGYMSNCWRFEIEGAYRHNHIKESTLQSLLLGPGVFKSEGGHNRDITLMANLFYDFYFQERAGFYLGVGAGIDFNQIKARLNLGNNEYGIVKKSNELFAWQIMPGLFVEVNDRVTLDIGYRFFSTTKPKLAGITAQKIPVVHNLEAKIRIRV